MATYTANYQLHQWVPEDNFLRTDFNQDFQKIDAALAGLEAGKVGPEALEPLKSDIASVRTTANGKAAAVMGSYTGDGSFPRMISLGYAPKAVYLDTGRTVLAALNGGSTALGIQIKVGGFQLLSNNSATNESGKSYRYMAVR